MPDPRHLPSDRAPGEVSDEPTMPADNAEPAPPAEVAVSVVPKFDLVLARGIHARTVVFAEEPTPEQIEAHRSAAEAEFDRLGETPPNMQDRRKPR